MTVWRKNFYIRYDGGSPDATGQMGPTTAPYGSTVTLPECAFSLNGYSFREWECAAGGETLRFADEDTLTASNGDLSLTATWDANTITQVDAEFEAGVPAGSISYQNKSYGYMYWSGSVLPVWQTNLANIFGDESRLGQTLTGVTATASAGSGNTRTTNGAGRSGIALSSITLPGPALYTKVRLSPYICVKVEKADSVGDIYNNNWYYTDRPNVTQDYAMNIGSSDKIVYGYSYYSRGQHFAVHMTVEDLAGSHEF